MQKVYIKVFQHLKIVAKNVRWQFCELPNFAWLVISIFSLCKTKHQMQSCHEYLKCSFFLLPRISPLFVPNTFSSVDFQVYCTAVITIYFYLPYILLLWLGTLVLLIIALEQSLHSPKYIGVLLGFGWYWSN